MFSKAYACETQALRSEGVYDLTPAVALSTDSAGHLLSVLRADASDSSSSRRLLWYGNAVLSRCSDSTGAVGAIAAAFGRLGTR